MRIKLTWWCPWDNNEQLNMLQHIGIGSDLDRRYVETLVKQMLDEFYGEIERHRNRPQQSEIR